MLFRKEVFVSWEVTYQKSPVWSLMGKKFVPLSSTCEFLKGKRWITVGEKMPDLSQTFCLSLVLPYTAFLKKYAKLEAVVTSHNECGMFLISIHKRCIEILSLRNDWNIQWPSRCFCILHRDQEGNALGYWGKEGASEWRARGCKKFERLPAALKMQQFHCNGMKELIFNLPLHFLFLKKLSTIQEFPVTTWMGRVVQNWTPPMNTRAHLTLL